MIQHLGALFTRITWETQSPPWMTRGGERLRKRGRNGGREEAANSFFFPLLNSLHYCCCWSCCFRLTQTSKKQDPRLESEQHQMLRKREGGREDSSSVDMPQIMHEGAHRLPLFYQSIKPHLIFRSEVCLCVWLFLSVKAPQKVNYNKKLRPVPF